jgi:cellulose synthase/poly-beta-1,6-N-acetylglucosamine synthase-like glycosyltransferase
MVKPKAPTHEEALSYLNPQKALLYFPSTFSALCLLTGMWLFTTARVPFLLFAPFALLFTLYLGLSYLVILRGGRFRQGTTCLGGFPTVDIYLPCCGEPLEILKNTYEHVRRLRWPGKLQIYVLDDGGSQEVKELAEAFAFFYIRRPNRGELKKAGNLRYAFERTQGEFITIFDADFCPHPEFLTTLMPYFTDKTAIVQSPQYFTIHPDQTWVEKGAAYIQELFYRVVQVSRDTWGAAICVGSNAIYRRKALEPFGGTAPIAYSEDVHTGFMCLASGWQVKYVPLNMAKGVCPDTVKSFFLQQYRWAMGSLTLLLNKEFWRSSLTTSQKACYFSGFLFYVASGVGTVAAGLPALTLMIALPELVLPYNCLFSLPSFLIGLIVQPYWSTHKFGLYVFRARSVAYHAYLFALVDKLRGNLIPWQASGAVKNVTRFSQFRNFVYYWNHFILITTYFMAGYNSEMLLNFLPTLFFTTFNTWINLTVLKEQES